MTRVLVPLLALTLAGCLTSPSGQAVPSFYRPGAQAPTVPEVYGQPVAAEPVYPRVPGSEPLPLRTGEEPTTWLENVPVAGPAPRNVQGGGILGPGLVAAGPEGSAVVGGATHGVEPTESGRLYILELYQEVLDQRDALQGEVAVLQSELERAEAEIARLGGRATDGESRLGTVEQEAAALRAENLDLAARLTTAQIRRLEAEKLLLETRIEIQRARAAPAAAADGGLARKEGK